MRTRTFIGLILLVIALIVASTPALLDPASRGIEKALADAGTPGFTEPKKSPTAAEKAKNAEANAEALEDRLMLNGYVADGNDLRDDFTQDEREANHSFRLQHGRDRLRVPGQLEDSSAFDQPIEFLDGVLLDKAGCPVFRDGADVSAIWLNDDTRALYEDKVRDADNPRECDGVLAVRVAEGMEGTPASRWALPGDRRDTFRGLRRTTENMAMAMAMGELYEQMFGDLDEVQERASATRGALDQ